MVPVRSYVPWLIAHSDLNPANGGEVEYTRDLRVDGHSERHFGLLVAGQFDPSMVLGMLCVRCERSGDQMFPLTMAIPETPIVTREPRMYESTVGVPKSRRYRVDADFWREDGA